MRQELGARKAKAPPRLQVQAPEGAPNVVIVLIDDMGFGQPSAFGGPAQIPTLERLAANSLSYAHDHRRSGSAAAGSRWRIIAQAGRFGGWSLYMKDGRVHEVYNFGGLKRFTVSSPQPLAPGRHTIRYDFIYDGGKPGWGGLSRLSVDGQKAGEVRVARTMPFAYSGDEGVDVGMDNETPVTEDHKEHDNRFTGTIHKVTVDVK